MMLQRIATADQAVRRNEVLALLREIDCSFVLYREHIGKYRPENIVVSFHEQESPRLVLGAHYDSVPDSTGANDNAAAVCILLTLIQRYQHTPPTLPVDIVFFDLEEMGQLGSQAYLKRVPPANILAMINLDICGVGRTLLCAPRKHTETGPLAQAVHQTRQQLALPCHIIGLLPNGDDRSFERAGVPNISLCIISDDDVETMLTAMDALQQNKRPEKMPDILTTMHNGPRDSITTIEEEAVQRVLQWTSTLIQQLEFIHSHSTESS